MPSPEIKQLAGLCAQLLPLARNLYAPAALPAPAAPPSADAARRDLRFLRTLAGGKYAVEQWLAQSAPAEQLFKAEHLAKLIGIFAGLLAEKPAASAARPVADARDACGAIALSIADFTLESLPDGDPGIETIEKLLQPLPEMWDMRAQQSTERLLDALAEGIEYLSEVPVDERTPVDKLIDLKNRICAAAYELCSIDAMQPPAREESIELAREILRRLKEMQFSDKVMKELIEAGQIKEKLSLARQIEEMTDSYRALLSEAVAGNPELMRDARVAEANDAVGGFAHAVSLMAAREIPSSMAAAQQITSEIAAMPEQWKNLSEQVIGRLVSTMEAGVDKTADELARQQEQAKEREGIIAAEDQQRYRRRRRGIGSSDPNANRLRKQIQELSADDFALKQGRFRQQPSMPPPGMPNLRAEDLAAVKALGGSLRNIGQDISHVETPDPVVPDDKKFAEKAAEQKSNEPPQKSDRPRGERKRNEPRNKNPNMKM